MIHELKSTPNTMVGFRVSADVTRAEFDRVLLPAAHELILRTGKLNYLFLLEPSITNYDFGSWLEEVMVETNTGLQSRAAIAIPHDFSFLIKSVLQRVVPGHVRVFFDDDLDTAIQWASGQKSLDVHENVFQEEDDRRE